MKNTKLIIVTLLLSTLTFAQSEQEQKEPAPDQTQSRTVDLPLNRTSGPLVLFDRAVKDRKGRCKVHHYPLKTMVVPIVYGLTPGLSPESYETERKKFPNAITRIEGGCMMTDVKEAKVLQCQKCIEAKERWLRR